MEIIRKLRKEKNITMKSLGEIIGVSESAVSQYENGKRQPDKEILAKLADYFNVSVDYLLGRTENKLPRDNDYHINYDNLTPKEKLLIENYKQLNEEGKEKLLSYSDDLVSSGKYIKTNIIAMDKEA